MKSVNQFVSVLCVLFFSISSWGGVEMLNTSDPNLWISHVILVGRIRDAHPPKFAVQVQQVLAGELHEKEIQLEVEFAVGVPMDSPILGDSILAVVFKKGGSFVVPGQYVDAMPGMSPFVKVSAINSPDVLKTIAKLKLILEKDAETQLTLLATALNDSDSDLQRFAIKVMSNIRRRNQDVVENIDNLLLRTLRDSKMSLRERYAADQVLILNPTKKRERLEAISAVLMEFKNKIDLLSQEERTMIKKLESEQNE